MNPWRGIGRLPKDIWVLCGTTLINRMGTMAMPFLIVYLTKKLDYSAVQAGLVLTLYGTAALVSAPFSGRLSDSIGPLRVMKLSLLLTGVVLLLFPFAQSYSVIIAATICWSVITEAFRPASLSIITDVVNPEQRKIAFSVNRLAINLGMSVGPAVGGFLLLYSFSLVFWVNGGTALIAGLVLSFTHIQEPHHDKIKGIPHNSWKFVLQDKRLIIFLIALFPIFSTFFQVYSTLPYVCVHDLGLPSSIYGLFFTINTALIILLEVPLNISMSHWPHRYAMALGGILIGIGFGGMMFASGFWSVVITVVFWTFGEMVLLPTTAAFVADISSPRRRGMYMGVYQMTGNAALAFSAWFGMKSLESFGASALWGMVFIACTAASLLFLPLRNYHAQIQKDVSA
jgi:MFS family permease